MRAVSYFASNQTATWAAHTGPNITDADWDISVKHLIATLDKFKVPAQEKQEVLTAISSLKPKIVNR